MKHAHDIRCRECVALLRRNFIAIQARINALIEKRIAMLPPEEKVP